MTGSLALVTGATGYIGGRLVPELLSAGFSAIDYAELRDAETLEPLDRAGARDARLLVAARLGRARLIDNMALRAAALS